MSNMKLGFKFSEGFNLIDEMERLHKTMTELQYLPEPQRRKILFEKLRDILVKGGHPKYQKDKD